MHLLTFANVKWARYSEKTDNATAQKGPFGVEGAVIIIQSTRCPRPFVHFTISEVTNTSSSAKLFFFLHRDKIIKKT